MIGKHWRERDPSITQNENIYVIPDADKAFMKEKIVESIISASDIIRYISKLFKIYIRVSFALEMYQF